jgi:plasmid stabilization system protein ParE
VRAARSGRHLIFFLHDPRQITVLTILHERANAKAHVIRAVKLAEKV